MDPPPYNLKSELLKVLQVLSPLVNENLIDAKAVIRGFEQVLLKDEEVESAVKNFTDLQLGRSSRAQQQQPQSTTTTTTNNNNNKNDLGFKSPQTSPAVEKSSDDQKDNKNSSGGCSSAKRGPDERVENEIGETSQRKRMKSSHNISTQTNNNVVVGESSIVGDNDTNNEVHSASGSGEDFNSDPNFMEEESHETSENTDSSSFDDDMTSSLSMRDESSEESTVMDTTETQSLSELEHDLKIKTETNNTAATTSSATEDSLNNEPEACEENSIIVDLLLHNINTYAHNKSSIAKDFWKSTESRNMDVNVAKYHVRVNSFTHNQNSSSEFTFFVQEKIGSTQLRFFSRLTFLQLKTKLNQSSSCNCIKIYAQFRPTDLQQQQVLEFLSMFGNYITHFSFDQKLSELDMVNDICFLFLLSENAINLQYLAVDDQSIHRVATSPSSSSASDALEPFLHLETLEFINTNFGFSQQFINTIFQSCPNLTNIIQLPLKFLTLVVTTHGKYNGEIKSVFLECSEYYTSLEAFKSDLNKLKNLNLELDQLVLPLYCDMSKFNSTSLPEWDEVTMDYITFLKRSAGSVKKLEIEPRSPIDLSKFPKLTQLKTLRLNLYNLSIKYPSKWMLNKWDLNMIFPEVKTLLVNFENYGSANSTARLTSPCKFFKDYFPSNIFKPGISLRRVKSLKLMNAFPVACLDNMMKLLPMITTLSWKCNLMALKEILPQIFELQSTTKIKKLVLELDLGQRKEFLFQYLDSVVTGMTNEKCEELRNKRGGGGEIENVEQFRVRSSILDLKDLELFQFIFFQPTGSPETRLFSQVAGIYGFGKKGQSPNLKVEFGFDSTCTAAYRKQVVHELRAVLPYVTKTTGDRF